MEQAPNIPVHSFLRASDGTSLSYYAIGHGPGLVVVHGAISFALSHLDLANGLSSSFTVYMPSRRGRGLSGPYPEFLTRLNPLAAPPKSPRSPSSGSAEPGRAKVYGREFSSSVLRTDVSDLADLVEHTGSTFVAGVSSGAVVVLQACGLAASSLNPFPALTNIRKVVLFDPPLLFHASPAAGPCSVDLYYVSRFEAEIAAGLVADALVTAMKIVQLGPLWLRIMPRFVIRTMIECVMRAEAKEVQARKDAGADAQGVTTMAALAPVLRYDFAVCEAVVGDKDRFAKIFDGPAREVLLLGGADSPGYLRDALATLEEVMEGTGARRVEMDGLGHEALMNRDRGGNLAEPLKIFKDFLS